MNTKHIMNFLNIKNLNVTLYKCLLYQMDIYLYKRYFLFVFEFMERNFYLTMHSTHFIYGYMASDMLYG